MSETDDKLLAKRFSELARKSDNGGYFTFTDFLGLSEQSIFAEVERTLGKIRFTAFGGAPGCERIMIRFGDAEALGYEEPFPISTIKAEPKSQKFADKLTHRDFLGAIMNLGIERSCLGDIIIIDNVGYIFAKDDMAEYICDSLTKIKHTDVRLSVTSELPEGELFRTEGMSIQLSSERLDAAVAKVFSLSREEAQTAFKRGLVFVCGRVCESASYTPKVGETISVRGHGRFIYDGQFGLSKKGKLNVAIRKYV